MLIHNECVTSKFFKDIIKDEKLNRFQPLILVGYSAKKYIEEFIREVLCEEDYGPFKSFSGKRGEIFEGDCNCDRCISSNENRLDLNGNENIEEFRDSVLTFLRKNRKELSFITCHNIERYPKETLDTFLKTLEEPRKNIKILASAFEVRDIPKPILSRFHVYYMDDLNKEELLHMVENTEKYKPYKNSMMNMTYTVKSIEELIIMQKFAFEDNFKILFEGKDIIEFENKFNNMIKVFKSDSNYRFEQIISEFLKYYLSKVSIYKMKRGTFLFWVNKMMGVNFKKLFEVINTDKKYMVSVDEQLKNFFRSCFVIRNLLES